MSVRPVRGGVTTPRRFRVASGRAGRGRVVGIGRDLPLGRGTGLAWGCDLSAEYVAINSEYRT